MKHIKVILFAGTALSILLLCLCTNRVAGGTETGNARIAGVLYQADGVTPAQGAEVFLRKKTLPDVSGKHKTTTEAETVVYTDINGKFVFDSVDTGVFVIEGINGNDMVFIDSLCHNDSESISVSDTLKPAGAVKGCVAMRDRSGSPYGTFVLAYGVNRWTTVDSSGMFRFTSLAKGSYTFSILPLSTAVNYAEMTVSHVGVESADTTNLDTLDLPYIQTPTVRRVSIAYDSLKEIVTLHWPGANTDTVASYNVYRRPWDSDTIIFLKTLASKDTTMNDSSAVEGVIYGYGVSCVSVSGLESAVVFSDTFVTITSVYKFVKVFAASGSGDGEVLRPKGITQDKNGNIYIVDEGNTRIVKFDSAGNYISAFGSSGSDSGKFEMPVDIAIDSASCIYVIDNTQSVLQKFDSSGMFIKSWATNVRPYGISISGNNLWVATEGDSNLIQEFDTAGTLITQIQTSGRNRDVVADNDTLITSSSDKMINKYVNNAIVKSFAVDNANTDIHFAVDGQKRIYEVSNPEYDFVQVFSSSGDFIGKFGFSGTGEGQISSPYALYIAGNKLFLSSNNGVTVYSIP